MGQHIKNIQSQSELKHKLKGTTKREKYRILAEIRANIESEIDRGLQLAENDFVIFRMSQLVVVEDELMTVERELLHKGVLI